MKVYVIERGCYSDSYIVGVVTSKEQAKHVVDVLSKLEYPNYPRFTEYDTEQFTSKLFRFKVTNDYDDWEASFWEDNDFDKNTRIDADDYFVLAESGEQAIKIAQDMEAEYKAKTEGIVL